jgi:hypothetical protein
MRTFHRWQSAFLVLALAVPFQARAAETDKYLPDSTEAIVTINVKQLLEAPLFKEHIEKLKLAFKGLSLGKTGIDVLGIDPLQDLEQIIVSWPGNPDQEHPLILIKGKFDLAAVETALQKAASQKKAVFQKEAIDGHRVHEIKQAADGETICYVGALDQGLLALSSHQNPIFEAQDKKAGKRKPDLRKDVQQLLAKADPKHAISVASLSRPLSFGGLLGNLPGNLQNVSGGLILGEDLKIDLAFVARDIQSAKAAAGQLEDTLNQAKAIVAVLVTKQKKLEPLADLLAGVKVTAKGSDVAFRVTITKDLIDSLFKKDE